MCLLTIAPLLLSLPAGANVTIDWVTVGDPGNACDAQPQGCFASVAEPATALLLATGLARLAA